MRNKNNRILINWRNAVEEIYGQEGLDKVVETIELIKKKQPKKIVAKLTHKDIFVITYANSMETKTPNLNNVPLIMDKYYPAINNIHFLPFFEWTSDDGFSVANYYEVDERNGNWSDIKTINKKYSFMFDFVVNHSSKSNPWFKNFLSKKLGWENFYIYKNDNFDYSKIIRPRTTPLFHNYGKNNTEVWSTFSEDQVDLNYNSVNVVSEVIKLLAFYVENGMTTVRLDAVGFIWKESGHNGMHHPITHKIIKILKSISFELFGELKIISEVNVPHIENMSYLGENGNESDEIYNFALPPMLLFTMLTENSTKFKKWMKFFDNLGDSETMFNFLASHDGIGQRPIESLLNQEEKNVLINQAKNVGAKFNLKSLPGGSTTVYEINSTFVDMLFKNNGDSNDYARLLFSHSLLMFLRGTPAIYINSLFAKRNYFDGVKKTGQNRAINREHFALETFDKTLSVKDMKFIDRLNDAMTIRKNNKSFDPYEKQEAIDGLPKELIGFKRSTDTIVYANVSSNQISFDGLNMQPLTIIIVINNKIEHEINWYK